MSGPVQVDPNNNKYIKFIENRESFQMKASIQDPIYLANSMIMTNQIA